MEYLTCNVHGEYRAWFSCLRHFSLCVDSCFIDFSNTQTYRFTSRRTTWQLRNSDVRCMRWLSTFHTDSCKYLQYTIRHIRFGNTGACSDCRATGSLKLSIRFVFCGKTTSKIVMDLSNTAELLRNPHSRGSVMSDPSTLSSISYAPCKSIIL